MEIVYDKGYSLFGYDLYYVLMIFIIMFIVVVITSLIIYVISELRGEREEKKNNTNSEYEVKLENEKVIISIDNRVRVVVPYKNDKEKDDEQ